MPINQRKHVRFSLELPATLITKFGERQETMLQQISIGGCFTDWEENIYAGDEFRLEIELPNRNQLPLKCKAVYRFEDTGIGVKFIDICQFEQELISKIIAKSMEKEGVPVHVSPFDSPNSFERRSEPVVTSPRVERETMLDTVMSTE